MESPRAKTRAGSGNPTLVVCKPNFAGALRAELAEERDKADFRYAKTPLIHE